MTGTSAQMTDREISRTELKQRLVSFAREIGFDSCRIAACGSAPHAAAFRNWLDEGGHGEMGYMARGEEKRCDPQKVLPDARSIVVLAQNYFHGDPQAGGTPAATGRIARYAWGDDYHDLIETKLDKIGEFLREFGGQQKCYVDTGPVLERDHAAQAGVGWHGKSTMLIDERLGTWFFLAEVLTTLELPPDLHARLPHRRHRGALSPGRAPLHFLSDNRTQRFHPAGASTTYRKQNFWLRRLS